MRERVPPPPEKRAASESVERLVAAEDPSRAPASRPGSIVGGVILLLLRALSVVPSALALVATWSSSRRELDLETGAESDLVLALALAMLGVWAVVLLFLSWLVWRQNNAARLLVMLWVSISIIVAAVTHFTGGEHITIRTTLMTLSLDILVLLALSSRAARAWSRAPSARSRRGSAEATRRR